MKLDKKESKRVGIKVMRIANKFFTKKEVKGEKKQKKNDFEKFVGDKEESISFRDEE